MSTASQRSGPQVGVWILADQPVRKVAERARLAESVGLDFVGITDGQMIWRDLYLCLTAAALETSRVPIGPWVTNPITRHPTVTANALCTLAELTGGRAFLGIGAGDDSVKTINKRPARLDELARDVELIRRLASGETVEADPDDLSLATAREHCPPIYWAAAGPRSFRYGGQYADGVIDTGWLVPELLEETIACIEEGAHTSGRQSDDVAKIFNTGVAISADGRTAREDARTYVAKGLMWQRSVQVPGWSEPQRQELIRQYNYHDHLSPRQRVIGEIRDDLITKKAVAGTPDEAVELLSMVVAAGYTHIALLPLGDVEDCIRQLGEVVAPQIR